MKGETLREARAPLPHGGRLASARKAFPGAPEPFLDLSTGINPRAFPIPSLALEIFARLPEPEALAALEAAAGEVYGAADPARVVAAPGTQALIALLPRLRPQKCRVAVLSPTYAEHAHSWRLAGHDVTEILALDEVSGADVLILCNPNNPDGRRHDRAALLAAAGDLSGRGGWLVVDEAFVDFEAATLSLAPVLPGDGVIVLRSFGKSFGLAGVRLGFAVAGVSIAGEVRAALGPWPVSGPAIAIGRAAFSDAAWLAAAGARLTRDAAALDAMLARAGFSVLGGTNLFRLAEVGSAAQFFGRLGRAGILTRAFGEHATWLRFGIPGDDTAFARLAEALGIAAP